MKSSTALLLFSRSASAEAAGKIILFSPKRNKKAIAGLIDNATQLAADSGLSWYVSNELSQTGNSFGGKLTRAIEDIFEKGHSKIIVLGNDCPSLTQPLLRKAIVELEHNDWVLGPTPKGGAYLIGITAASFNAAVFEKISWQTDIVFQQLTEYISSSGDNYSCFSMLNDVNNEADILTVSKKALSNNSIIRFLINLFTAGLFEYQLTPSPLICISQVSANSRRGPPINNNILLL